jgi:hypothetical protein
MLLPLANRLIKFLALVVVFSNASFSLSADSLRLAGVTYQPATNIEILWNAPTNLPDVLPVYKMMTRTFSPTIISNAMVLASFKESDMVVSNATLIRFQDRKDDKWNRFLNILPEAGQILYYPRAESPGSPKGVPDEREVSKRAWNYLSLFGIGRSQVCELPENRKIETCPGSTNICSRGVFLSRVMEGSGMREMGFGIDFGSHAKIRDFYLLWPSWKATGIEHPAVVEKIIQWLKDGRMLPTEDELPDAVKIEQLKKAKILIITSFNIHYGEGRYGELPSKENEHLVSPFGVLKGVANLENTNINFTLYCPIF